MRASFARFVAVGLAVLVLTPAAAGAQGAEGRDAARGRHVAVARNYAASWETAAAFVRSAVSSDDWAASLGAARRTFGALRSREQRSATPATSLPGAPDGDYIVFQFDSAFANKAQAVETVTFVREPDGIWRAAGYFVR